jgi:hypothetical protein
VPRACRVRLQRSVAQLNELLSIAKNLPSLAAGGIRISRTKLAIERLRAFPRAGEPGAFIDSFFADLSEWVAKPKWSGGGFTRVVVELADLRGHPARSIARNHKTAVEQWLADGLATGGVSSQRERAREIMLLTEGAMALMLIHGDRSYAQTAARAAKLVRKK